MRTTTEKITRILCTLLAGLLAALTMTAEACTDWDLCAITASQDRIICLIESHDALACRCEELRALQRCSSGDAEMEKKWGETGS